MAVIITLWCFNVWQNSEVYVQNNLKSSVLKGEIKNVAAYVLATLLNQGKKPLIRRNVSYFLDMYLLCDTLLTEIGGYIKSNSTTVRLVIGSWCLLVLVLLNTYNGRLISYMTATGNARPLVNSVTDIVTDPNIKLVVNKGQGADVIFSVIVLDSRQITY